MGLEMLKDRMCVQEFPWRYKCMVVSGGFRAQEPRLMLYFRAECCGGKGGGEELYDV
jgi:hypothetical protein